MKFKFIILKISPDKIQNFKCVGECDVLENSYNYNLQTIFKKIIFTKQQFSTAVLQNLLEVLPLLWGLIAILLWSKKKLHVKVI